MDTVPDPRTVTLNASGNGSVFFRGKRPNMLMQIRKLTIETTATGSGTVAIYYRGQLMTSKAIALLMTAVGVLSVAAGEEVEVRFTGGAANAPLKVTSHYEDVTSEQATSSGMVFNEAVGFTEPVDQPVLLASETALNSGNPFQYFTGFIDMRAYKSYALLLQIEGGTLLNTDMIEVDVNFGFDNVTVPNRFTYFDAYQIARTDLGQTGPFRLTDLVKGSYMKLSIFETLGGPRNANLTFQLWGSYREVPENWLRGHFGNVLFSQRSVLGVGPVSAPMALAKIGYGRATLALRSGAGGGATVTIQYGDSVILTETFSVAAANTYATKEIILPKRIARVTVRNDGAAGSTIDCFIIQEGYPQ